MNNAIFMYLTNNYLLQLQK